ncbi:hypothetical protein [Dehalogenimonas etheniformans]|uniref:Uncharacterized protein n=1 Tax=Dehalogenimonas etheniformans TaxID=1536648 RepID=A0A2P5P8A2_9CHLR|nr:hypothetical protein [Dehalogenimonas etheniformans]PPD58524.1 hypothetical protein JP09_001165 [Dehalogenimonas etheniformans]QNT76712.1 hypothetical protein HX448_08455 [Dehalogenimonas etheniformans]
MPVMIGLVGGFLNGLGIDLLSKGNYALGIAWFLMGFAVAWMLYMRVREDQKAAVKVAVKRQDDDPK